MRVLDATVTRRSRSGDIIGPDQRVDVITALEAMTLWPACQYFEEDRKGSIKVGKLADLVILSNDPTAVDLETLDQLVVAEKIKEGETIYAAGEREGRLDYRPCLTGPISVRASCARSRSIETWAVPRARASRPASSPRRRTRHPASRRPSRRC